MVYISRIEIRNFKSFEGAVNVELVKGFNAVTGRNGSGKSNIIDAIRFAFGENSVKALRENRMQALINDRGRGRSARVSVYLANEGDAPFKEQQLVITRELLSNGEQRYYINGRRTSRNNVVDLLYSMGISSDGLNIVPQGAIGRIAEMNPSDRRELLEDLIGLNVYDEKREEAMNRLREADALLNATFAKLDEKRDTMIMLEDEMNSLLRYETLQRDYLRIRKTQIIAGAEKLEREAEEAMTLSKEAEEDLRKASEELEEISRAELEPNYEAEIIRKYASIKAEAEALKRAIDDGLAEKARIKEELEKLDDALKRLNSMKKELAEGLERAKAEEADAKRRLETATKNEALAEEEVNRLREKLKEIKEAEAERRNRGARLAKALSKLREARTKAEWELLSIKPAVEAAKEASSEYENIVKINEEAAKKLRDLLNSGTQELRDEAGRLRELLKRYEELNKKRTSGRERLVEATTVLNRALGYIQAYREAGLEAWQGLDSLFDSGIWRGYLGRLGELIEPKKGYEGQVAAVVSWLGNPFVFSSIIDTSVLISMERLPRLRVAWPPDVSPEPCECSIYWKVNVKDSRAENVVKALLARICVGECDCCEAVVDERRVIRANGLAEAGSMHGRPPDLKNLIVLAKRLETELVKRSADLEGASKELKELRLDLERSRARAAGISAALRPVVELVSSEEAVVKALKERINEAAEKLGDNVRKVAKAEAVIRAISSKEAEVEEAVTKLLISPETSDVEDAIKASEDRLKTARKARAEAEDMATRAAAKVYELSEKLKLLGGSIEDVMNRASNAQGSLDSLERRLAELESRRAIIEPELTELEEKVSLLGGSNSDEVKSKKDELMKKVRELERKVERLKIMAQSKADEAAKLRSEASGMNVEPFEWTDGLDALESALSAELSELSQKVNRMAYRDYMLYYESYRDASAKRTELERDREAILKFIEEIDKEKSQTFMKAFEMIDRSFREIFSKLVDGAAWLELENPNDPFNGGVFMLAKFGDKKEREAASLSGGEKAIASVAFLLALQAAYKSHFYIFDEIDANLDAERSRRLGEFLNSWGKENQIILVSLKDTLISKADRIIGVYEREGSSRAIELRVEELERGK